MRALLRDHLNGERCALPTLPPQTEARGTVGRVEGNTKMSDLQKATHRTMRTAAREYIRERVTGKRREIKRETDQEIRDAMARAGWMASEGSAS